jgi:phosphate/sulfate permease
VTPESVILVLVVVTALGFDFTNGFHDTANAMATSIAPRALRPRTAVALSGVLNLIGAYAECSAGSTSIVLRRRLRGRAAGVVTPKMAAFVSRGDRKRH